MLSYKILFTFIFLIRQTLNGQCTENICKGCIRLGAKTFFDCKCSKCTINSFTHVCTIDECEFCRKFGVAFAFDCYCSKCTKENTVEENTVEENSVEEKKENNSTAKIVLSIISIFLFLLLLIICCCCGKCIQNRNDSRIIRINPNAMNYGNNVNIRVGYNNNNLNRVNIQTNDNINSNNIIVPINKEITLDEIFSDVKKVGPKKCKKEYEKYNIECTICLDKFKDDIDMISLTPCSHLFHHRCLYDYFQKNKNAKCPNCNFDIVKYYKK